MTVIERVSLTAVERHLESLGRGNHSDNMERLRRFECHCLATLSEADFLGLVFLQSDEVLNINPRGGDRTLIAVAQRAISLGQPRLSNNWDLAENLRHMREKNLGQECIFEKALAIREASNGEEEYGPWYLQDGSHRALAQATLILTNEARYEEQRAYCSMGEWRYWSLLREGY